MKHYVIRLAPSSISITEDDFRNFLQAKTYEERMSLLIAHSKKNQQIIKLRRSKTMNEQYKTQEEIEREMNELNKQFSEFLHTKGIAAKFRLAFSNMGESAAKQHEKDKADFEEVKRQSAEDNKEFVEFLHTKGVKAKVRLVVKNIKEGAKNAPQNTAAQIARATANATAGIPHYDIYGRPVQEKSATAQTLAEEFEAFLKEKGLEDKYSVEITEEE